MHHIETPNKSNAKIVASASRSFFGRLVTPALSGGRAKSRENMIMKERRGAKVDPNKQGFTGAVTGKKIGTFDHT